MNIINLRIFGVSNAATAATVDTLPVPPGKYWFLTYLAIFNNSGETVTARAYIGSGSQLITIKSGTSTALNNALAVDPRPLILEGQFLRAEVTGTAQKGPFALHVTGFEYDAHDLILEQVAGHWAAGAVQIATQQVPPGELWLPAAAIACNQCGGNLTFSHLVTDGDREVRVGLAAVAANNDASAPNPFPALSEGQRYQVRATSGGAVGRFWLYLTGWRLPVPCPNEP